jgi:hypothetical protein
LDRAAVHLLASSSVALLLVAALCACAGGDSGDPYRDGQNALNSGDAKTALEHFDAALAKAAPTDSAWIAAKQGQIAALARVDRQRAHTEALALLSEHHAALGERGARTTAANLVDGSAYEAAFKFLEATVPLWPESDALDNAWSAAQQRASSDASPSDLKDLQSIGYLGGKNEGTKSRRPGAKTPAKTAPQ